MTQIIIFNRIAAELNIKPQQVVTAVALLDEGATVPFIARYRKEVTGALDDNQLRDLEERLHYLRDLEDRRATILKSIDEQGKLTVALKQDILSADTKTRLEELYLPYKPKRRTKGQIAIEAGLEPLAIALLADPSLVPAVEAVKFLNAAFEINDTKAALDGAKYILMERFAEDADLLARLRMFMQQEATLSVRVIADKAIEGEKFTDYFTYDEPLKKIPSHRALAILRGRNEGVLTATLVTGDPEEKLATSPCEGMIAQHFNIAHQNRAADDWLAEVVKWTWRIKLLTYIEMELLSQLREKAEADAIKVFADNLKDLLLAAPAGPKVTIGLDPGLRTGVKVAVVDATGKVLDHTTIYPTPPQKRIAESETVIGALIEKYNVSLIAIGNGTGSRETDTFVGEMLKQYKLTKVQKIVVNEAGASVYSASELAAKEFPDLDVTIRGAVSIARRLQDPLAELVKIEPKSIGVGQYQHDVNQSQLARMLNAVVEDCVNAVGVDLNTASAPLLTRVSGLSSSLASNIVQYREANGAFKKRSDLMAVPRLGGKAFEQSAGFLRIMQGDNPLDASAVHPESYHIVEKIAQNAARDVASLIGDSQFLTSINTAQFVDDSVGEMTIKDILNELEKPGRDPRPAFKFAAFKEGVESIKDLEKNMLLEGVITNVAAFGAFVDIGVHQDGLVHISALSDQFISDPRAVVKAGDIVKVKVMDVDVLRKRIALSMRLSDDADVLAMEKPIGESNRNQRKQGQKSKPVVSEKKQANSDNSAMASAFASARQK
jgi:uncharacterized protein